MREIVTGIGIKIQGHLKIVEYLSHQDYLAGRPNRELLNKRNAVHKENALILLTKAITDKTLGSIAYMEFGNGGTTIDPTGHVLFNSPHDTGTSANLYNPVFFQLLDDTLGALPGNQMGVRHISNSLFSDVDIRCLVGINQPFGQLPSNIGTGINLNTTPFAFDEIGLKLIDGTLITHVIFTPVLKTANTLLEVVYTLRVAVGQPAADITHVNLIGVGATGHAAVPSTGGGAFTTQAVRLDGSSSFWDFPTLSNSSTGTMSVWLYLPRMFGFHPYAVDDFLGFFSGTSYLLAAKSENELFLGNGWTGDIRFTIASVSNAVQAVITVNAKLSELVNMPTKVLVKGFGQGGGWSASGTQELNVISNTDTTVTVNWNTSGLPVYNPALNTNTAISLSYISNITSANPAVITTIVPHGIDASVDEVWIATAGLTQTGWTTWATGGPPPVQVLSTTSTTITVNASSIGFPAWDPKLNSGLRIYILNAFNFYANSSSSNANFISYQSSKPMPNEQWVNLLLSWDTGQAAGSKKVSFYYGDTALPLYTLKDFDPSFVIPYSNAIPATNSTQGWKVSGNGDAHGTGCLGYMAEFWFAPGTFMDFSNSANRALFHDLGTGKPVDLGADGSTPTGSAPSIYLSLNDSVSLTPDPALNWVDPSGFKLSKTPLIISDSTQFVLSFWCDRNTRMDDLMDGWNIFISAQRGSKPFTIQVQLFDVSNNRFFFNFPYDAGTGANITIAVDSNHTIGNKIVLAYVNNVAQTVTVTADEVNNFSTNFSDNASEFDILAFVNGYISEFWFGPGQFFDPIHKFADVSNNPINLGVDGSGPSGTAPIVFLHRANGDPVTAFGSNKGTGGDFTGAASFVATNGTRFSDNLSGTGRMLCDWSTMQIAPTSPSD